MSDDGGSGGDLHDDQVHKEHGPPTPCPRCASDLWLDRCPSCGLVITSEVAAQLQGIDAEVASVRATRDIAVAEVDAANARLQALAADRFALVAPPPPPPIPAAHGAPPAAEPTPGRPPVSQEVGWPPSRPVEEWQPAGLRTWLLILGVGLLVLAGIAFAAVTWPDLDDTQRAGVLGLATAVAAGCTEVLRRRLPATAEALCTLSLLMLLVDWGAVRRAGVAPEIDPALWWAAGQALVAGAGVLLARRGLRAPLITSPALAVGAGLAVVLSVAHQPWTSGVGFALVSAAAVAGSSALRGEATMRARSVLEALALIAWNVAIALAFVDLIEQSSLHDRLEALPQMHTGGPALALLSACLAPLTARLLLPAARRPPTSDAAVGLVAGPALAALAMAVTESFDAVGVLLIVGVAAIATVLIGRAGPLALRSLVVVGLLAAAPGAVIAAGDGVRALTAPSVVDVEHFSSSLGTQVRDLVDPAIDPLPVDDDRRPLLAVLSLAALLIAAASDVRRGMRATPAPDASARGNPVAITLVGLVLIVAGATSAAVTIGSPTAVAPVVVGVALAVGLVTALVVVDRRVRDVPTSADHAALIGIAAGAAAWPAVRWSLIDPTWAPVVVGSIAVLTSIAVAALRTGALRQGAAIGAGGLWVGTTWVLAARDWGGTDVELWLVLTVAWAAVAVVGLARRDHPEGIALESVGIGGLLTWTLSLLGTDGELALATTLAAAVVGLAGFLTARPIERKAAPLLAAGAAWAWLGWFDVRVNEAWSVSAALGLLGAHVWPRGGLAGQSSRAAFGWPLIVGFGPAVLAALGDDAQLRPALVTAVAVALVGGGVRWRVRAPLEAGTVALVLLGVDLLGPFATELPRWLTLGGSGAVVLWLGATVENRAAQVRAVRDHLDSFE